MRTPVACPYFLTNMGYKNSHGFTYYLLCLSIAFFIYNIAGVYYNQSRHNKYGFEAVPHIEKWR